MKTTQITKIMHTETGHRLTSYASKCAHLHGHRYTWEVTVTAPQLDDVGFIIDYSDLKQVLLNTVDLIDHAFLFHDQDPLVVAAESVHATNGKGLLDATNGQPGRVFILPFNPTSENLVEWMGGLIQRALPRNVDLTHIRVWETANSFCDYTPELPPVPFVSDEEG